MIDITPIIQALIGLLATIITVKLIPWIRSRTTESKQAYIAALTRAAVYAAEQLYQMDKSGPQKLDYVRRYLQAHGIDADTTQIEAAVYECINDIQTSYEFHVKPPDDEPDDAEE